MRSRLFLIESKTEVSPRPIRKPFIKSPASSSNLFFDPFQNGAYLIVCRYLHLIFV